MAEMFTVNTLNFHDNLWCYHRTPVEQQKEKYRQIQTPPLSIHKTTNLFKVSI